jgi:SAM-dependent methyltransferase
VVFDPQAFSGTARYYTLGRPPYSARLAETLAEALHLDGTGRLLDVGCGPGVVVLELAHLFGDAVALDPEPGMLAEAQRRALALGAPRVTWVEAVAEDLAWLDLGPCRLVTFGQSFHRVQRLEVAETVYDLLDPGGAIALITHAVEGRVAPPNPGYPTIPHDEERFEQSLARTRFAGTATLYAPGRPDLLRDIDSVVAGYFSMSYAAPRHFGPARDDYEAALRRLLASHAPEGLFWDWPGDTEIVLARKL